MNTLKHLFSAFNLLILTSSSLAQTTPSVWPITSVELYQTGAMVEHSDSVRFEGEDLKLKVSGLGVNINRQSIQVDLPNGIVLESLSYKIVESDNLNKGKLKSVNDSIVLLKFQKQMFEALLHTLNEEKAFLQANREIGSDQEVLLVDDLIEMADFLRERNQDLGLEILDVQLDISSLEKKIEILKREREFLNSQGKGHDGVATLHLSNISSNSTTEYLSLRYLTNEASWSTNYSLYFEEGEVFVKRHAKVQQNTGVDWTEVDVELVSGRPQKSLKPNGFESWIIEEDRSIARVDLDDSQSVAYRASSDDIELDKSTSFAGDTRFRFEVDEAVNLKSSSYSVKVDIENFTLEGDVEYYAVPAINSSAYAIIRCSEWSDKRLMNGRAEVVSSNSYLGWYHLRVPIVGDTLDVNLGADPHVLCSRSLKAESSTVKRFAGKNQVVQTWELAVENTHSDTTKVNLADKLPKVKNVDADIEITTTTNDGGLIDSAKNEISFDIELAPLERTTVTYVLTVTYPSSMNLKNL